MRSSLITYLKKENITKTGFGARAYTKFINMLENYDGEINTVADLECVDGLSKGKIFDKCIDVLTGKVEVDDTQDETLCFFDELMSITEIGKAKASSIMKLGINDMETLEKEKHNVLNDKQLIGLKYHKYDKDDFSLLQT